ncbi:carboxypeptidase regulatory-like domain-containing protein [Teredinibacter turnerae]|uniref:carboxypeptidase regulatory-like domain-containing protein n=1 Tax=Teredinibacter turnerae TaxID=2426 RepID=UPI000428DC19|nr:carboxypeptidase regulatory-like domain-containing protein [Teredinibacter turnerae]
MYFKFAPRVVSALLGIVLLVGAGNALAQEADFLDINSSASDGSIASANDSTNAYKSTAEAVLTYQLIGLGDAEPVLRARDFLTPPTAQSSTENVALWITAQVNHAPVSDALANLLSRQNSDGGFAFYPGYSSEVLSSGFALHALAVAGYSGSKTAAAIGYLADTQRSDGSWSLLPGAEAGNIELTAIVASSLWEFRRTYTVGSVIDNAINFLQANRGTSLWHSTEASALALNAILTRLIDRTPVAGVVADFANLQQTDKSFDHDVYTTALGLRVLHRVSTPSPDDITISGVVVDAEFGTPIDDAIVELFGPQSALSNSEENGTFALSGLAPGYYDLTVSKEGFNTLAFSSTLQPGARLALGDIALARVVLDPDTGEALEVGSIRGTITHRQTGEPLPGATISLRGTAFSTVAGVDGTYTFVGVPAATYNIDVAAAGFNTVTASAELKSQQTLIFSPSLQQVVTPGVEIAGQIKARSTDDVLAGALVSVTANGVTQTASTATDGSYRISDIPAGPVAIRVVLAGYHPVNGAGDFSDGAEITFSPLLDEINEEQQTTPAGIKGSVVDKLTGVGLADVAITVTHADTSIQYETTTGADGDFLLADIAAGNVTLAFALDGYVTFSGDLQVQSGLLLDLGLVELGPVDPAPTAALSGRVIDVRTLQPLPGVVVTAAPDSSASTQSMTDDSGQFTFPAIFPGSYQLQFVKPEYVDTALAVDIAAGDSLNIGDLRMRAPGIDALLPDLSVVTVNTSQLTYDQATLAVTGEVTGTLINLGNAPVASVIQIRAFEDNDFDGVFSSADQLLGETEFGAENLPLIVDTQAEFNLAVEGTLSFYQAPIIIQLDSGELLAELSEANNLFSTAKICSGQAGVVIDLALCMDGSGSINATNFTLQKEGTASAIEDEAVIPRDGSVRISAYQFAGSSTRVEIAPTIIEADNATLVADAVRTIGQSRGGTPMASCLNTASQTVLAAEPASLLQAIDISTDGAPNSQSSTRNAAANAQTAGIDVVNAIGVGAGANISFLNSIVFPQPAGGERGFVVAVNNFADYVEAVRLKIQREVQTVDLTVGQFKLIDNGFDSAMTASVIIGNAGTGNIAESVVVTLYDGAPENGGQAITSVEYADGLNSGGSETIVIDGIDPASITSGELVVVAELATGFSECNQVNNQQTIPVLSVIGDISVVLSGSVFGPQSTVGIASTVVNTGALAGNYTVALSVLDMEGTTVYGFSTTAVDELAPSAQLTIERDWDTGFTVAGNYRVEAVLYDREGTRVNEAQAPFRISDLDSAAAVVVQATTDRPMYNVNDNVSLGIATRNFSQITALTNFTLEAVVSDPQAQVVYSETINVLSLVQGQYLEFERNLVLAMAAEGIYTFNLQLKDALGMPLADSSVPFDVVNDSIAAITGSVSVLKPNIEQGELQSCHFHTQNSGVLALNDIPLNAKLVNLNEQQVVGDTPFALSLLPQADSSRDHDYGTAAFMPGRYACVLEATLNGVQKVLSSAQFTVLERPIHFSAQVVTPADPNLLVLVDGQTGEEPSSQSGEPDLAQQAENLSQLFSELQAGYLIASDADTFSAALNSGNYNQVLLLAENIQLNSDTTLALEQSVLAGSGAIASAQTWSSSNSLAATFGAYAATPSPTALGVRFQSDRYPGVASPLLIPAASAVTSFHLQGAVVDAWFEQGTGIGWQYQDDLTCVVSDGAPAILYNEYVDGHSILAGIDWALLAASDTAWAALLKQAILATGSSAPAARPGESIPLKISVASATGGAGRILVTPPAQAEFTAANGWELTPQGQWAKPFLLAQNDSIATELNAVVLAEGSFDWLFEIQTEGADSFVTVEQYVKTLVVSARPSITDIIALSANVKATYPRDAWLALSHESLLAAKALINAGELLAAKSTLETAIQWLAKSHSEIHALKVAVAERYLELIRDEFQQ